MKFERTIRWCLIAVCVVVVSQDPAQAAPQRSTQSPTQVTNDNEESEPVGYLNWNTKTLGGQQFWTDVRHASGWKIQVNSETGHCRLLDANSVRKAWGNLPHCQQALDQQIALGNVSLPQGKVVILLHGLIRTNSSMQPLADYLSQHGYTVINFQYASTRNQIGEHAAALKSVMEALGPAVTEVNFIGHSMGNIVVRRYLGDTTDPQSRQQGDPRIKRMVMLGPPNQGSRMARILKSSFMFQTIAGVSGSELARSWDKLEPTLATPQFEFGIIAGGQETEDDFSNFILKGKDDFTVSVEEAKLAGAHDFVVRPLFHSTMMHQPEVLESTLRFLENGFFETAQARTPLRADDTDPDASRSRR